MKKFYSKLFGLFRLKKDKKYTIKFRIYPYFMFWHLDKWLKCMSLKGWKIVHCGIFWFVFEKSEPIEREYFTYTEFTQECKYSITLRHPFLEKKYGVNDKKSKINSNMRKSLQIVEIDAKRIDVKNDIGYRELTSDRNKLYLQYFFRNIVIIVTIIFIIGILLIYGSAK